MPAAVTAELAEDVRDLGLSPANNIVVWPVGIAAVMWDGEGSVEWLTSEEACIAIQPDHDVSSITFEITSESAPFKVSDRLEVVHPEIGQPIFVGLPLLAPGAYKLRVAVEHPVHGEQCGYLKIVIREPTSWNPSPNAHNPLSVVVEPRSPTLEELWHDRVSIEIRGGPVGSRLSGTIALYDDDGCTLVSNKLPLVSLPMTASDWRATFDANFRQRAHVQNTYDNASLCVIDLSAGELGSFRLECARESQSLRWVVRRIGGKTSLVLRDDSGFTQKPVVKFQPFETPDLGEDVDAQKAIEGFGVGEKGGLYVAVVDGLSAAVIVAPSARRLSDLLCEPTISHGLRSAEQALNTIATIRLWSTARLTGNLLARKRQREVLLELTNYLFGIFGGERWSSLEFEFVRKEGRATLPDLMRAVSGRGIKSGIAAACESRFDELYRGSPKERATIFSRLSKTYLSLTSVQSKRELHWLPEFALRLASDPANAADWSGSALKEGVIDLLNNPELARAARLLVLIIDVRAQRSMKTYHTQYARWDWNHCETTISE
jgi:hypothetical protein